MLQDCHDHPITAAGADAVGAYNDTLAAYFGFARDTGEHLKASLKADPEMAMAQCLRGYFFMLMGARPLRTKAQSLADKLAQNADKLLPREQAHIAALQAWSRGQMAKATALWEDILLQAPRDLLALKLAHFTHFYQGHSQAMRDSILRVLPAWSDQTPHFGFLQGMQAFGLEECGDYAQAEAVGRQAVERNPADIWAVHAVAHVMEMQDRQQEGIAWLTGGEAAWRGCNNFRYHAYWHQALMLLDQEKYDEVLAFYDEKIWDPASDEYLDLCNDTALLARLHIVGVDVGARWQDLIEKIRARLDDHLLNFVDAHYMLALSMAGDAPAADAMLNSAIDVMNAADSDDDNAKVTIAVGAALLTALRCYGAGDYRETAKRLAPVRYQIQAIGGSHAQRDLFQQILIDAARRSEALPLARALLAERVALKPNNQWSWQRYHDVLKATGDADTAQAAQARIAALENR